MTSFAPSTTRRFLAVLGLMTGMGALASSGARASEVDREKGSTQGLLTDRPYWSGGLQLGNSYGSGLNLQTVGLGGGAVNVALGIGKDSMALVGDYIWMTDGRFRRLRLKRSPGYVTVRGLITPYVGAGLVVGPGFAARIPFGVQYTMLRDPFNFFVGAAPQIGRLGDSEKFGVSAAFVAGARVML